MTARELSELALLSVDPPYKADTAAPPALPGPLPGNSESDRQINGATRIAVWVVRKFSQNLELGPRIGHIGIASHRSRPSGEPSSRAARRRSLASRAAPLDVHGDDTSILLSATWPASRTDETTGRMSFEVSGAPPWIYKLSSRSMSHPGLATLAPRTAARCRRARSADTSVT
jgi:hypothetical protein